MRKPRKGITILETMLTVFLVSLIATLAVTLIHLGHRTYESVERDNQHNRELTRFANRFREAVHRASVANVTENGHSLTLQSFDEKQTTTFVVSETAIAMQQISGDAILRTDSFAFQSGVNTSNQSNSAWGFHYDKSKGVVVASHSGQHSLELKATLNLLAAPGIEDEIGGQS